MILTVSGVKIKIDFLFTAVVAFLCVIDIQGFMWMSFTAVIVHEIGHIAAMIVMKVRIREVRLACCGVLIDGAICFGGMKSAVISIAGPIANLTVYLFTPNSSFGLIMLITGVFNLIPIIGTDGGDLLRIVLCKLINEKIADIICFVVSVILILALLILSFIFMLCYKNPTLFAVALYLISMMIASAIK